ncbi:MAG: hypothetical protein RLP02_05255, partial [Coleofasciculus sp. C2-GNP5-27]
MLLSGGLTRSGEFVSDNRSTKFVFKQPSISIAKGRGQRAEGRGQKAPNEKIAAIDLGIDNLMAVTSNQPDFTPLLINGRPLKSLNQFYN